MSEQEIVTTATANTPVKLGISKQAIAKLRTKYKNVPDATTAEGYEEIKLGLKELVPLRTGIEAERKKQNEAALAHQRRINAEAKDLTAALLEIETPYKDAKAAQDAAEERRREEAAAAESARVAKLEAKVAGIQALAEGLLGASVDVLEARMAKADAVVINSDEFGEYLEPGLIVLAQVKSQLNAAIVTGKQMEALQKQLKEQADALAAANADNEALRQKDAEKQADAIAATTQPVTEESAGKLVDPVSPSKPSFGGGGSISPAKAAFKKWWNDIGSGIVPNTSQDMEEFARRVAVASWAGCMEFNSKNKSQAA